MNKQIKITNYNFGNYTVKDRGTNHSDITNKMVQLAGRLCEHYAGDIVYDANAFIKAIEKKQNYDRYLFFREMGVTALTPEDIGVIEHTDFIQAWHLTYNAETEEQEFTRVSVYFEKVWF
jgi:hypothetical protein